MEKNPARKETHPRAGSPKPASRFKKVVGISAVVIVVVFSLLVMWFIGRPLIEYISQPEQFRLWVDAHGMLGRLAFVGMVVLQIIVALLPGEVFELGAGYAFGFWEGTLLCMAGALIGNLIVFALVRTLGVRLVEVFFPIEKIHSLRYLRDQKRLSLILFFINLIPGTPKDLFSYAAGLTPIRLRVWMLITLTARIPSIVTSTMAGSALGDQNYMFAIVVYAVTTVVSIAGLLAYRQYSKKHAAIEVETPTAEIDAKPSNADLSA